MQILFVDGTAGFTPHKLAEKPCGGIVTSLTIIPQYLARKGYDVTVASEFASEEKINEVKYVKEIRDIDKRADVVIFNRNIFNHAFLDMFPTAKKVWWLHDIVDYRYMEDDSYLRMDRIVSLSDYCTASYSDFFRIPKERFVKIPNGVDKSVFYPGKPEERDRNLFVTASATVKGLYPLWFTFHNLKRNNPKAELRIYSSQKLHGLEDGQAAKYQLKQLEGEGAKILDPIPQKELADVFRKAQVVLFPSHYPEICSNLVLQAQACGAAVVSTGIGSAREFISDGLVTSTTPADMFWWWKEFAHLTLVASKSEFLRPLRAEILDWEEIGNKWESEILNVFN